MFEISEQIYSLLNVPEVLSEATGGVSPMLSEQRVQNYINYTFGSPEELSKDKRVQITVKVDFFAVSYNKALKMFDAVDAVMKNKGYKLIDFDSEYLNIETDDCGLYAVYNIRKTI